MTVTVSSDFFHTSATYDITVLPAATKMRTEPAEVFLYSGSSEGAEVKAVHIPSDTLSRLWPELTGNLLGDKSNNALFDNSKIKAAVPEFMTRTRFDQGARECVEYMYSHPECRKTNPEFDAWYDRLIEAWDRAEASFPAYEGPMY